MSEQHVEVSRDGGVLVIRFANEKSRNSMTTEFREQLRDAVLLATSDASVRAVYITGKGAAFCAGGDLRMLKDGCDPWPVHKRFQELGAWFLKLIQLEKPVLVGVNGVAVGGGIGIALTGDVVVAAESAKFMSGFFRLGVVPDIGMMYLLPRMVGMARAKRFLFENQTLTAREAMDIGMIADVVPDADLEAECMKRVQRMAQGPSKVMGLAKMLLSRTYETGLHEMFLLEDMGQALAQSSGEFREGLSALMEKRSPDFLSVAGDPAIGKPPKG